MGRYHKILNKWHLLNNYLWGKVSFNEMPGALVIEATNRCHMSCIMCPREDAMAHPCDMSFDLCKQILDQSKKSVHFVDFSFRGEPLLNDNIFAMIQYAKKLDLHTSLQTNGMLLDETISQVLLNSRLDLITISIDALSTDVYNKIRKGGDLQLVVQNVKRLLALKENLKSNLSIAVQIIPMKENMDELEKFKAYWKGYRRLYVRTKPFSTRSGLLENNFLLQKENSRGVSRTRCSRLWNTMFIYADGTVVPCCNDFLCKNPLGDLMSQSVAEVWNGKAFMDLRQKHARREFDDIPLCKNCEVPFINFYKHVATFLVDDLSLRKILINLDLSY